MSRLLAIALATSVSLGALPGAASGLPGGFVWDIPLTFPKDEATTTKSTRGGTVFLLLEKD